MVAYILDREGMDHKRPITNSDKMATEISFEVVSYSSESAELTFFVLKGRYCRLD